LAAGTDSPRELTFVSSQLDSLKAAALDYLSNAELALILDDESLVTPSED
jgi:hypothetical protein